LTEKPVKFSNLPALVGPPPSVPPRPFKEELNKSKFHEKSKSKTSPNCSYTQASLGNIKNILKIKENLTQLLSKKIEDVHKVINNLIKPKLHINMTTKGSLQKQIIVLMDSDNIVKFMRPSGNHVANIN